MSIDVVDLTRRQDPVTGEFTVRVLPGQCFVTGDTVAVSTTLGSSIAACIRDAASGVGGVSHFLFPGTDVMSDEQCVRYGRSAMDELIRQVRQRSGGVATLEVKVFGGGSIVDRARDAACERSIRFVRGYLTDAGMEIVSEDLGGPHPRKIVYYPDTGRVLLRRMRRLQRGVVAEQEREYRINAGWALQDSA